MALIASVAAAVSAICAAVAMGGMTLGAVQVPVAAYALCLLPGVAFAGLRPERNWRGPDLDIRRLAGPATGVAMLLLAVLEGGAVDRLEGAAPVLAAAVVPVSGFWPVPGAIRLSVLLAATGFLGAGPDLAGSAGPLAAAVAATAVALVAAHHLASDRASRVNSGRFPPAIYSGAGLARRAALVAAVVGLVGLVAAALLPPPVGGGSGGGDEDGRSDGARVGGPVALDSGRLEVAAAADEPGDDRVLRVAAARADVWRAGTYDLWDGRAWDRSPVPRPPPLVLPGGRVVAAFDVDEPGLGELLRQRVTVDADVATALVAAPRAVFFEVPGGGRGDADGWLLPAAPLGRGTVYVVESRGPAPEQAGGTRPGPPARYRHLPAPAARVSELAAAITTEAGAVTTEDKARALERWLGDRFRVVDAAPELPPGDAVELVLFGGHPATPRRLATALAVMLRTMDVPARVGVGFLPGQRALLGGEFVVRAGDAHVWTEAWSPEAGWQRFDPTGRIAAAITGDSLLARLWRLVVSLWPALAAVVLAGAGWLVWRWADRRRRLRARPWATRYFDRLAVAGADNGRPRRPEETAAEYTRALVASVMPDERLLEVGDLLTRAAYSDWQPSPEDQAWAELVLRDALTNVPSA